MELLELLLLLLIHWRAGLGLLAGVLAAFLLAGLAGGGGAATAIVTILLGLGAGMLWQLGHERSKHERPDDETR